MMSAKVASNNSKEQRWILFIHSSPQSNHTFRRNGKYTTTDLFRMNCKLDTLLLFGCPLRVCAEIDMWSIIKQTADKWITRKLRSCAVAGVQSIPRVWMKCAALCAGCAVYRALCVKPLQLHRAEAARISRLSSDAWRREGKQLPQLYSSDTETSPCSGLFCIVILSCMTTENKDLSAVCMFKI